MDDSPIRKNHQIARGERQIARILAALADGPQTAVQLEERLHMCPSGLNRYLRRLQDTPRRIRVADYLRNGVRPLNIYALGSEPDTPFVRSRLVQRAKPKRVNDGAVQCAAILAVLQNNPLTVNEIAHALKSSITYVRGYLKLLHDATPKRVYVLKWAHPEGRGSVSQVFAIGARKDAERQPHDRKEYDQRIKADPAKHETRLARRRMQKKLRKAKASGKSLNPSPFAALGL